MKRPDIVVAADEVAVNEMLRDAETMLGTRTWSGSGQLGPFDAPWTAHASVANGHVVLVPTDVIRIEDLQIHYKIQFALTFDLDDILPPFCLPPICLFIPFWGVWCLPTICFDWPTVTIPVNHADVVTFSSDFALNTYIAGPDWIIDITIVDVPNLQLGTHAAAVLAAIGAAASIVLAPIPFIGPILALAVALITAAIGIAGVTGYLGTILTQFIGGLKLTLYQRPKIFTALPVGALGPLLDPEVKISLDLVRAAIVASEKNELVIIAEIS